MKLSVFKNFAPVRDLDLERELDLSSQGGSLELYMGRAEDCFLELDGHKVSRHHAALVFEKQIWTIRNISDFGDLLINGQECGEKELRDGDIISIGDFQINVSMLRPAKEEKPGDGATGTNTIYMPPEDMGNAVLQPTSQIEAEESEDDDQGNLDQRESEGSELETDDQSKENHENEEGDFASGLGKGSIDLDRDDLKLGGSEVEEESGAELDLGEDDNEIDNGLDLVSEDEKSSLESGDLDDSSLNLDLSPEINEGDQDESSFPSESDEASSEGLDLASIDSPEETISESTQVVSDFATYYFEISGEVAPYDRFKVEDNEIFIGRDQSKCSIFLNDTEVSNVHAVIRKTGNYLEIEDLNSSNGTVLNEKRINKEELRPGDVFLIGSTRFVLHVTSEFYEEEKDRLMPVEDHQVVEVEELIDNTQLGGVKKAADIFSFGQKDTPGKGSFEQKRKMIIYGLFVLVLAWVLFDDGPSDIPPEKQTSSTSSKEKVSKTPNEQPRTDQRTFSEEEKKLLNDSYLVAESLLAEQKYREALKEIDRILKIDPNYKRVKDMQTFAKKSLAELEEAQRKIEEAQRREEIQERVKNLVSKAKTAVAERKVEIAEALFGKILELDPENFEVTELKLELDAWKKEQERLALIEAQKKAERDRQIKELKPGKDAYLRKEWYKASMALEKFIRLEGLDEEFVSEATQMLEESQKNLENLVAPLLKEARSFKEGQDFKRAYEKYSEVLKYEPTNEEALREMSEIQEVLNLRARNLFWEGMVSESLSLFDDAREKYQEVQQISPTDSEYYQKATRKLKDYLD